VFTYHHEDNGVFRFLKGHGVGPMLPIPSAKKDITTSPDYVVGKEDDDWEQETAIDHNWYKGTIEEYSVGPGDGLKNHKTITAFCSGCHGSFHGPELGGAGMGSISAWIRHPTDIALPQGDGSEYAAYDLSDYGNYSVEAPVAWTDPTETNKGTPIVMCLSCHRPHGSPYSDLLRWDYDDMQAGTADPDKAGKGCFTCHTEKDGIL
jgi:hypothetical protein